MNVFAEGPPGAGWALESVTVLSAGWPAELLWLCAPNQGPEGRSVHPEGKGGQNPQGCPQGGLGTHPRGGLERWVPRKLHPGTITGLM